jgi:hypothetical protein
MAAIDATLAALDSLELGEDFEYSAYAKKYGCSRTTLSRRHQKVQEARTTKLANGRLLNTVEEQQLVQYIKDRCARGLPPSRPTIRNFASDIAKKPVGKNWVDRFVKRHSMTSVLSASDWRKIERLLTQAVDNIYDTNSKKLSHTIHTISVKNTLLQHENSQLKEALAD